MGVQFAALGGGGRRVGADRHAIKRGPDAQAGTCRAEKAYWRYHGGHWSHWDPVDSRWYYTDGSHWYYNNGNAWALYRFDKAFGREGFERGTYAAPAPNANVVLPTHEIYVAPR